MYSHPRMLLDPASFDGLSLYRYRLTLRLARPLSIPAHRRSVLWRGAFGAVFRSLVCHDIALDCQACPLRTACPFPRVFAPAIPEGRPAILRLKDPPRPFVIGDPHPTAPALPASEPLSLGLTLVGSAAAELPYFVVSFRRLGQDGFGPERVRFEVDRIACVDAADMTGPVVYERGSDLVRPQRIPLRARDLARPGDATASRARLRFLTPVDLRGEGDAGAGSADAPAFGVLLRRARNRATALATFFGEAPIDHDPRALAELADSVTLVRSEVGRTELMRRSSRTGQRHPVGGVVGSAVYEGEGIGALMPWLRLAELIGVGKHATFGNGRVAVDVLG